MAAACYERNKDFYAAMSIVGQFIEQEDEARIQIILRNMLSRYFVMWAQGAKVLPPPLFNSSSEEDSEDDDDDEDSDDDCGNSAHLGLITRGCIWNNDNDGEDDDSQQERRTDPMLGGERVTLAEMCYGLRNEQLSLAQLQEHWNNLKKHPGEVPESAPKPKAGA